MRRSSHCFEAVRKAVEEAIKAKPLPADLVYIEELADEIARRMPKPYIPKTDLVDLKNFQVSKAYPLLELNVAGKIEELTLKSKSKDYTLTLNFDEHRLQKSWSEFHEMTEYLKTVDAFTSDDYYILHLEDINWTEFCTAIIAVPTPTVFENIFVKVTTYHQLF